MTPHIIGPQSSIPDLQTPFAAVIDTDDGEWREDAFVCRLGKQLLEAGCRYLVCFGQQSEGVHDRFDDLLIDGDFPDTMTTYHYEESESDVASFVRDVVMLDVKDVVVIAHRSIRWSSAFDL